MNDNQIVVFAIDFHGHGYSTGIRAYMESINDLEDDLLRFIKLILRDELIENFIYNSNFISNNKISNELPIMTHNIQFNENLNKIWFENIRNLPYFLVGQSMGGAVVTMASRHLFNNYPNYIGTIGLAPSFSVNKPHWLIIEILRYTFGLLNPTGEMIGTNNPIDINHSVKNVETIKIFEADTWGKPGALGYGCGMRWGTALMFLDMTNIMDNIIPNINFPFLFLHDPDDKICDISGTKNVYLNSKTMKQDKKLIEVNIL